MNIVAVQIMKKPHLEEDLWWIMVRARRQRKKDTLLEKVWFSRKGIDTKLQIGR